MARRTRQVTLRRYHENLGRDKYRNVVPGYVDELVDVYAIAPRESVAEVNGARVVVITGAELFAPIGFTMGRRDLIVDRGLEYGIDGDAGVWDDNPVGPGTTPGGVQIKLERRSG